MKLINAEKLFSERPEYRNPIHEKNSDFNKGWNACVDTFCDIIKDQPTAYDVEKVIEELEKYRRICFLTMANTGDEQLDIIYDYVSTAIEEAINIVRHGGV